MSLRSIFLLILIAGLGLKFIDIKHNDINNSIQKSQNYTLKNDSISAIIIKKAEKYARKHLMDTTFAILIDYKIHSGKKRAFLVDLKHKLLFDSFLVSHGCGNNPWGLDHSRLKPQFSNTPDSHCSSLGHYKIGKRGYSSWGINVKYLLFGLDSTNSNALKRQIVMHGWADISDSETYPIGSPEGWGCPAFSNNAMTTIDSILNKCQRPVLLWSF
ncbi:MAG: murein L,D-transpeptidase catalytic domain family protein [Bacteroidia bacterium]|nr:murein L,D-transpeptidase catalytic domain family protein [Bacteroidia bacterium]